jgi:hypothetical protein
MSDLNKCMDAVNDLNKSHGVKQRGGKMYTQVVHRMEAFRRHFGTDYGVDTQVLVDDGQRVVIKATIINSSGIQVGSGMAEEIRGQGHVNQTSALENAETSAVGRALASLGLAGGEYASANEMDGVGRKTEAKASPAPVPAPQPEAKPEYPDSPEKRRVQEFMSECNSKLPNLKTHKDFMDWVQSGWVKENMEIAKQNYPEMHQMIRERIVLRNTQLKPQGDING